MTKRTYRMCGGGAVAIAVLLAAAAVLGIFSPKHGSSGRLGWGLEKGQALVIWGSDPVQWVGLGWRFPSGAGIAVGPRRVLLPSRVHAQLTAVTATGQMVTTLKGVYIPLWPGAVVLGTVGIWLWRRGRRPEPGHCPVCGYDLAGLKGCPECGEGRLWRGARRLLGQRARVAWHG